jgi:hypothetical protein
MVNSGAATILPAWINHNEATDFAFFSGELHQFFVKLITVF